MGVKTPPLTAHQRAARAYQKRKRANGLCPKCGVEPLHRDFHEAAALGLNCLRRQREREQAREKFKPWKPGSPGRPPKWM